MSQGTAVAATRRATARTTAAAGSIHHSRTTVRTPTTTAIPNGGTTLMTRSCSESTSCDHPGQQVTPPEDGEAGGRQTLEPPVHRRPEVGEQPEGGVVADEPLLVPEEPSGEPEELDPDDGHGQLGLVRVLGRPGDQPRRPCR